MSLNWNSLKAQYYDQYFKIQNSDAENIQLLIFKYRKWTQI